MRSDDAVGFGWCIVVSAPALLRDMTDNQRRDRQGIGGRIAVVTAMSSDGAPEEFDGVHTAWFRRSPIERIGRTL